MPTTRTSCRSRPPAATASGVTKPIWPARPGSSKSLSKIITGQNALNATCHINPPKHHENQIKPAQFIVANGRDNRRSAHLFSRARRQGGGAKGFCFHDSAQRL